MPVVTWLAVDSQHHTGLLYGWAENPNGADDGWRGLVDAVREYAAGFEAELLGWVRAEHIARADGSSHWLSQVTAVVVHPNSGTFDLARVREKETRWFRGREVSRHPAVVLVLRRALFLRRLPRAESRPARVGREPLPCRRHRLRWVSEDPFSNSSLYACHCGVVRSGV